MKENDVKQMWRFALPMGFALAVSMAACEPVEPCLVQYDLGGPYMVQLTPEPDQTFDPSCPDFYTQPWVDAWMMERWGMTRGPSSPSRVGLRPIFFTTAYGEGEFTPSTATRVGDDFLCTVPTLGPITEGSTTYEISDLTFLEGAAYQGQAIRGDVVLRYGASCEIRYDFQGMWPGLHGCNVDEECDAEHGLNAALAFRCHIDPLWAQPEDPMFGTPAYDGVCVLAEDFPSKK